MPVRLRLILVSLLAVVLGGGIGWACGGDSSTPTESTVIETPKHHGQPHHPQQRPQVPEPGGVTVTESQP